MDIMKHSITRLSGYRDVLLRFKSYKVNWIYSEQIASATGTTAAQVRKDFSLFKVPGKRKSGYEISSLIEAINRITGKNKKNSAVLVFENESFGKALYEDYFLQDPDIHIDALFSTASPYRIQHEPISSIPVFQATSLVEYISAHAVTCGIIAVPNASAQKVMDIMIIAGIHCFLCLTTIELKCPKDCTVKIINPIRELESLTYFAARH
jgi:redox-sensing transcriptional repressor